jgi:hypothetical protein
MAVDVSIVAQNWFWGKSGIRLAAVLGYHK